MFSWQTVAACRRAGDRSREGPDVFISRYTRVTVP